MPRSIAPGGDRAATLDPEHVLDRHEERLVDVALGGRDVAVDRIHQRLDRRVGLVGGIVRCLERLERGAADDRDVVTGELVLAQQLADLELDEVEQLLVVDHVDLVEEDHDVRDLDLARQQDVLAGLGHGPVGGGDDEDRAVHLGGARDHVLDVVGVARAVDVGVVAAVGLVLDVGDRDGDPALALLGRVVDRIEGAILGLALQGQVLGDRGGQTRLAVVDVADRPNVDVRLVALELLLGHETVISLQARRCRWLPIQQGQVTAAWDGGAHNRTRTDDLFLTKEVLCQLSYVGPEPIVWDTRCWWAGRESNPQSRRRLVYSQLSSPPAQPTH